MRSRRIPAVWAQTALFVTYDENDGFFDHLPAPAVPSFNADGTLAGAATLPLAGEYFNSIPPPWIRATRSGSHPPLRHGTARAPVRDFALEPRRVGNSEVFDHTSIAIFSKNASASGSPASAPGTGPSAAILPRLSISPAQRFGAADLAEHEQLSTWSINSRQALPPPNPPATPQPFYQAPGVRPSRALAVRSRRQCRDRRRVP